MPETRHERVEELIGRKDWAAAMRLLEPAIAPSAGLDKVRYLAQRCHAERGLARLDRARDSLEQALAYADEHRVAIPGAELFRLAEQCERNGQLQRAAGIVAGMTADAAAERMGDRLAAALDTLASVQHCRTRLIALGQDCLPDHLAMRWGFAPLTIDGPFGAAMFEGDGAAVAIADDFRAFAGRSAYRPAVNAKGFAMAELPAYCAALNHQLGRSWLDARLLKLRALYRRRIGHWRAALARDRLLFVASRVSPCSIERLWQSLAARLPAGARARLVVFDFLAGDARPEVPEDTAPIRIVPAATPPGRYLWYLPKFYNSAQGIAFERALAAVLIEEIAALEA